MDDLRAQSSSTKTRGQSGPRPIERRCVIKYFIDTEFNEEVDPIEIISLGVVAADGRELYVINHEYTAGSPRWESTHPWVRQNVKPFMFIEGMPFEIGGKDTMRNSLRNFVGDDLSPEFWGYFADYDWFLICRLFGSFDKMPKRWSSICYDVRQFQHHAGSGVLPAKLTPEHNALIDARWTKLAYEHCKNNAKGPIRS